MLKTCKEISTVFSSFKRILILTILQQPMGYTKLKENLDKKGKAGSSEIYKHLKVLQKYGYITKVGRAYVSTLKGKIAVELLKEIVKTKPIPPKLTISFKEGKNERVV